MRRSLPRPPRTQALAGTPVPFLVLSLALLFMGALALIIPRAAHAERDLGGEFASAFETFLGSPALEGSFRIEHEGDRSFLVLGPEFRAKSAPDLKVFLSERPPGDGTGQNATREAVRLGRLEQFEGRQRYLIPEGTDLAAFSTVLVHCEAYSKLWVPVRSSSAAAVSPHCADRPTMTEPR